jgi:hypothetical protein
LAEAERFLSIPLTHAKIGPRGRRAKCAKPGLFLPGFWQLTQLLVGI